MIKACIFDLDGTLTNTLDSLEYSVNETMKEIGMPQITKEQCRQFVGDGAKVLLERTLKAGGDTKLCHLEEAVEAYARIFDANCMYQTSQTGRLSMWLKKYLGKNFLTMYRDRRMEFLRNRIRQPH